MAICGAIESEYSETKEFTTPKKKENEIECGKDVSVPDIDDSEPLQNLKIGDKINVGGFEATIIKTEGSGGTFTGKCVVHVTTFSFWVQSEFENISINQSMQVTAGEINAIKGELKLLNVDALLDSLGVGGGNEEVTNPEDSIFVFNPGDSIIVTLGGEDFIITGDTTIITAGGDTIITDLGLIPPIIIINGDTIIIDDNEMDLDSPEDGNVTEVVSDSTLYALNYVKFKEYENPTGINFGFDEYPPEIPQYLSEYKKEKVLDQEYIVPWQSAEANGKPVQVNMHIKTKVADSINTRLKVVMNNQPLNFTMSADNDTIRLLNLNGQGHKNKEQITAYYINDEEKEIPIGYLNLISYERQNFNLLIVPVDGEFSYTEFALKTYLNKVYAPAITSWEAQVADQLVVEYDETEENGLNTSRSFLSSFNKEMKSIIEAMKDRGDYSKENYYLFVMDKAENESLNGLMPFNSHFGFLFTGDKPTETKIFRTIAHELAHGAFKLKHNFDDKKTEKRSTQNLLDYTTTPETATILRKFQWDEIISPRAIAFGWSEELYSEEMKRDYKVIISNASTYGDNEESRIILDENELNLLKSDNPFKLTYNNENFEEAEGNWKLKINDDNKVITESSGIFFNLILSKYDADEINIEVKKSILSKELSFRINIISIEHKKLIENKFDVLKEGTGKRLTKLRKEFNEGQGKVDSIIESKGYDAFMIKGMKDEYISEGMSSLFEENTINTDELDYLSRILLNMIEIDKEIIQLIEKQKVYNDIMSDKNKEEKSGETQNENSKWDTFINTIQEQLISKHKRKLEFNMDEYEEDLEKYIIKYINDYDTN